MIVLIDDIIIHLYISYLALNVLEHGVDGCLDPSEWPFDHYTLIMEAADTYYSLRDKAIEKLGEKEMERQYSAFEARCSKC